MDGLRVRVDLASRPRRIARGASKVVAFVPYGAFLSVRGVLFLERLID